MGQITHHSLWDSDVHAHILSNFQTLLRKWDRGPKEADSCRDNNLHGSLEQRSWTNLLRKLRLSLSTFGVGLFVFLFFFAIHLCLPVDLVFLHILLSSDFLPLELLHLEHQQVWVCLYGNILSLDFWRDRCWQTHALWERISVQAGRVILRCHGGEGRSWGGWELMFPDAQGSTEGFGRFLLHVTGTDQRGRRNYLFIMGRAEMQRGFHTYSSEKNLGAFGHKRTDIIIIHVCEACWGQVNVWGHFRGLVHSPTCVLIGHESGHLWRRQVVTLHSSALSVAWEPCRGHRTIDLIIMRHGEGPGRYFYFKRASVIYIMFFSSIKYFIMSLNTIHSVE